MKETHYYADDLRNYFAPVKVTEEHVAAGREVNPAAWFHHARIESLDVYDSLFPASEAKSVRMEASPSYLASEVAANRIAHEARDPLVVVIVRNPYERIVSHYEMNKRQGITSDSLEVVLSEEIARGLPLVRDGQVALTRLSLYADDVQRLIEAVGKEKVYVVRMEQLRNEAEHVLGSICNRLGLPYDPGMLGEERQHNRTLEPRAPRVNKLLRQAGLLQFAKGIVPSSLKRQLIDLYYKRQDREPSQYKEALRLVEPFLRQDLEDLAILLEDDYTEWVLR